MNKCKCNEGVACDVQDCKHNEAGCKCSLKKVNISCGNGNHHFCKSYNPDK